MPSRSLTKTNVFDVAAYILRTTGYVTTWKLQKLVYYCQAWSIVWDDVEMFPEEIRAWANGPVVEELYYAHRGKYRIRSLPEGDAEKLSKVQQETVDIVLDHYGDKSPQWLSDLTHMEDPWKNTRQGLPEGSRSNKVISKESLGEYYGSLQP